MPPSQRGATGSGGGRSLSDLAEARGVAAAPAGRSLAQLASAVEKGGSAALGNGIPLGAETEVPLRQARHACTWLRPSGRVLGREAERPALNGI